MRRRAVEALREFADRFGATIALISSPSSSTRSFDATTTPVVRAARRRCECVRHLSISPTRLPASSGVTTAEIDVSLPKSNDCSGSHGASISVSRMIFAPTVVGTNRLIAEFAIHLPARRIVDARDDRA